MNNYLEQTEKRLNRIVAFFYCLLIISLPVSIALVESMAGFVILFFVIKKFLICRYDSQGRKASDVVKIIVGCFYPKGHFLNKWIGFHALAVFISVLLSQYPQISLIAFVGKFLEGYLLYYSLIDCIKTKELLRNCLAVFIATAGIMAADGVFQYVFKWELIRHLPLIDHRVVATFRHPNDFGAYLIVFIPIVFGLLILPWKKGASFKEEWRLSRFEMGTSPKAVKMIILGVMLTALGLTFSRGSWVGFWVAIFIFAFLMRRYFVRALLISLVFLGIFLPLMVKYRDVSFTTDTVDLKKHYADITPDSESYQQLPDFVQDRVKAAHTFQLGMGRFAFWETARDLIYKYPFFGSGLNTYSKLSTVYAHNCYLQMAAETGLIGLISFFLMMGVFIFKSIQICIRLPFAYNKAILAGTISGLVGFMIQSGLDTTLYSVQLGNLMWVMMGFIAALQVQQAQSKVE